MQQFEWIHGAWLALAMSVALPVRKALTQDLSVPGLASVLVGFGQSARILVVLTAVVLTDGTRFLQRLSVSQVRFRRLGDEEIHHYVSSGEAADKAGAYGIQGRAAMFIEEIRGSYSGIMGLPLFETAALLRAAHAN